MGFYSDHGIIFDYSRREVDPEMVSNQAILEAGPLFGRLELQGLSEEELECLKENKTGSDHYIKLGKHVIKDLIYLPVHNLIEVLRTAYGQYWLRSLNQWDSRHESLGSYCQKIQLEYSLDEGKTWNKFTPDKSIARITATLRTDEDFIQYLTEKDWREVEKVIQEHYQPSLASQILSRAQEFVDQGNLKYAFIEGVSAFEVAISEFIRKNLVKNPALFGDISSFWKLSKKTQLIVAAGLSERIKTENIENAIKAIEIRNALIHDGSEPPSNSTDKLTALFNVTAALVSGPEFRFLTATPSNIWQPKEKLGKKKS